MLAAVNPTNLALVKDRIHTCHSQGELVYLIEKQNLNEITLDPQLPGHLSQESFIQYLNHRFPDLEINILGEDAFDGDVIEIRDIETGKNTNVFMIAVTISIIQLALSLGFQFANLTPRTIIILAAASFSAIILGGMIWQRN